MRWISKSSVSLLSSKVLHVPNIPLLVARDEDEETRKGEGGGLRLIRCTLGQEIEECIPTDAYYIMI